MATDREIELAAYAKLRAEHQLQPAWLEKYDTALRDIIGLIKPSEPGKGVNVCLKDPSSYAVAMVSVYAVLGNHVVEMAKKLVDKQAIDDMQVPGISAELAALEQAVATYRKHAG